jgi:hypothetical protein
MNSLATEHERKRALALFQDFDDLVVSPFLETLAIVSTLLCQERKFHKFVAMDHLSPIYHVNVVDEVYQLCKRADLA